MKREKSKEFYKVIENYHDKTESISQLINDYFNDINRAHSKKFFVIRIEDFEIVESNIKVSVDTAEDITEWYKVFEEKEEISKAIFKVDSSDKVFLFKVFEFHEGEAVISGYVLEDSVRVRTFLASLSEIRIQEKYERIFNIGE